jgi:hypothetical protein
MKEIWDFRGLVVDGEGRVSLRREEGLLGGKGFMFRELVLLGAMRLCLFE